MAQCLSRSLPLMSDSPLVAPLSLNKELAVWLALFIILQIVDQSASGRQEARQTPNEKTGLQLRSLREAFWAGAFFLLQ